MDIKITETVGSVVARDYRTAPVFKSNNIDFCCKGGISLEEACKKKSVDPEKLLSELDLATAEHTVELPDFNHWPLDELADYIEKRHHRYVEQRISEILPFLHKLVQVHGRNHAELWEIRDLFSAAAGNLVQHMKKEELILFPRIRKLVQEGERLPIEAPISVMLAEHESEGSRLEEIARLTDDYNPPADACTTYRVTYDLLREFEEDLHMHIHLENNILFPRAMRLSR